MSCLGGTKAGARRLILVVKQIKILCIPTERLKDRISQLCQRHGIRFIEIEESATS